MQNFSIADVFTASGLATFVQVVLIDLIFSGDNAIVLGALTADLPARQRKRVLALGVTMAMVCLVGFALIATALLKIVGLPLAGGLLLLWVAWNLHSEIGLAHAGDGAATRKIRGKSFGQAVFQVALTNLSLSLDNVIAVAGAARYHPATLLFGLALSVTLMAVAADFIAHLIQRHRWIAYIGLLVVLYVALGMIYHGLLDRDVGVLKYIGL